MAPFYGSQPGSSPFSQPGASNWMSPMPSQSAGSPLGGQPGWNQPAFPASMGAPFGQPPAQQQPWNTAGMVPWQQGAANPWGGFQSSPSPMAGSPWGSPQPYSQQPYSPFASPWGAPPTAGANSPWGAPPQAPGAQGCRHRRRRGHLGQLAHRARRSIEGAAQDLGDTARGAVHGLQRTFDNFTDPDYRSGHSGPQDYYDRY